MIQRKPNTGIKRKGGIKRPQFIKTSLKRRKGGTGVKRSPARQMKVLRAKLWELCKLIVRKRDGNVCFICKKENLEGSGWHTGHFIPSSTCGAYLRFDLRNLHSSCYRCNINLGGNGSEYYRQMVIRYKQPFVDLLFEQIGTPTKLSIQFYEKQIERNTKVSSWDSIRLLDYTKLLAENGN